MMSIGTNDDEGKDGEEELHADVNSECFVRCAYEGTLFMIHGAGPSPRCCPSVSGDWLGPERASRGRPPIAAAARRCKRWARNRLESRGCNTTRQDIAICAPAPRFPTMALGRSFRAGPIAQIRRVHGAGGAAPALPRRGECPAPPPTGRGMTVCRGSPWNRLSRAPSTKGA